jgi:hypothetical protein
MRAIAPCGRARIDVRDEVLLLAYSAPTRRITNDQPAPLAAVEAELMSITLGVKQPQI